MPRPVPVPPAPHNANTDLSFGFAMCVENFSVDLLAIDGVLENSRSHGRLRVYMRRRRPTVLWCTLYFGSGRLASRLRASACWRSVRAGVLGSTCFGRRWVTAGASGGASQRQRIGAPGPRRRQGCRCSPTQPQATALATVQSTAPLGSSLSSPGLDFFQ